MATEVSSGMYVGNAGARDDASLISWPTASNWGAMRVAPEGAPFQEWVRRGYVFSARSGAAAAIPVNTTCTNAPTLWNPLGSGKDIVLIGVALSPAAIGTPIIDGLTILYETGMGDTAGTGLGFATFTNIAPKCLRIDAAMPAAAAKFANATVTWTAQPAVIMDIGIIQWVSGTAGNDGPMGGLSHYFKAPPILAPGSAVCLGAATAATSTTYWTTFLFAELPAITF
jgi:hypothetical protein